MQESSLREEFLQNQPNTSNLRNSSSKVHDFKTKYFQKQRYLSGSSLFQTLFFTWISPLLTYGNSFEVNEEAIPELLNRDKPKI